MSMEGFAQLLAKHPGAAALREKFLKTGSLISWPSTQTVGVTKSKDAQRINTPLLKLLADFWCPQWSSPAMIPIDSAKNEASGFQNHFPFQQVLRFIGLFSSTIVHSQSSI